MAEWNQNNRKSNMLETKVVIVEDTLAIRTPRTVTSRLDKIAWKFRCPTNKATMLDWRTLP
jgi:hypothetical protein